MKKDSVGRFIKYFLLGALSSWLILTVAVLIRASGHFHLSQEKMPGVIKIYLIAGLICGLAAASFFGLLFDKKRKAGKR